MPYERLYAFTLEWIFATPCVMRIFNLGSINIDHIYRVPKLPLAGETLTSLSYQISLGGKGANQSVAAARAGAQVIHMGACAAGDLHYLTPLKEAKVDLSAVRLLEDPSGHAIVLVDERSAENQIVIYPGANQRIMNDQLSDGLSDAKPGDWCLAQNETARVREFFNLAKKKQLQVCYCAAPFSIEHFLLVKDQIDLLVLNAVEAKALEDHLCLSPARWPIEQIVITQGAKGVSYYLKGEAFRQDAPAVTAIDTTGAGDTFTGYLLARLCQGDDFETALALAIKAAALQVTRPGTTHAIPWMHELENLAF